MRLPIWIFGICFLLSSRGLADEQPAKFRLGYKALNYSSANIDISYDGQISSQNQSGLNSYINGWELYLTMDKLGLYLYPGQEGSALVATYQWNERWEFGSQLKIKTLANTRAQSSDPSSEDRMFLLGFITTYYHMINPKAHLELSFIPEYGRKKEEISNDFGTIIKVDRSDFALSLIGLLDYQLRENFSAFWDVGFNYYREKDRISEVLKTKKTWSVTLLGLRQQLR